MAPKSSLPIPDGEVALCESHAGKPVHMATVQGEERGSLTVNA